MDLRELRDELNIQKGAYNESVKNNKNAIAELIELLQEFGPEQMRLLAEFDINTEYISSINFEQLTTDKQYLDEVTTYFTNIATVLEKDLCKNLGIAEG